MSLLFIFISCYFNFTQKETKIRHTESEIISAISSHYIMKYIIMKSCQHKKDKELQ